MTTVAPNYKLNRGTVTLPSVFDWGGAPKKGMNILRDPPRSITTLRVDKALMTSLINEEIDSSADRACEAINVYARGVNPMVSVSYNNQSNNAGTYTLVGNNFVNSQNQNAKIFIPNSSLPYKSMNNGEFRPPVRTQRDLQPLSQLNRLPYDVMSKPGFVDFSKTKYCPTAFRQIKDLLQNFEVNTGKSQNKQEPIKENYKMQDTINEKHINIKGESNTKTLGKFERDVSDLPKSINHTVIEAWADTNPSQKISQNLSDINISEGKYIHDFLNYEAVTNNSSRNTQNLNDINMDTQRYIQNTLQYETPSASHLKPGVTFIGEMGNITQERNLPEYEMYSSMSDSRINKNIEHINTLNFERNTPITSASTGRTKIDKLDTEHITRDYKLPESLKKQSFKNEGFMPRFSDREDVRIKTKNDETKKFMVYETNERNTRNIPKNIELLQNREQVQDFVNSQHFGRWQ
jgi:hypothetical protein